MEDITKYNKKEIFEAEIKPIVNNLIKLCNRERIPCFMTFLPSNTDKDLNKAYENFYLSPGQYGIHLDKDQFRDHINITVGFHTTVFADDMGINIQDFDFEEDLDFEEDVLNE
jgi:hypothetical protein